MSLDTEVVPAADGTPVQSDVLEATASPLAMSLQDFVAEFGDELLDSLNRANPSRLHRPGPAASPARAGQSQAQAVRRAGRGGACRYRAAGRPRRTRRDRQWRDGLRQDHGRHRHGGRAARRRLSPHADPLAASPGLQMAPGNPGDGGRRQGLGAQWPGHAGQAHQTARAIGACRYAARSSTFSVACGCAWVSTGSPSSTCGARGTAKWAHARTAARSSPISTASRSTRSNSKPRTTAAGAAIAPHRCGR